MYFKNNHASTEFNVADFLKRDVIRDFESGNYVFPQKRDEPRGVPEE